jgi:molybdopterin-binding protein
MAEVVRIGAAAAILGVSVETLRRWEREGRMAFERTAGGQRVVTVAAVRDLIAERRSPGGVSARNHLDGTVVSVTRDGVIAQVELACGPFRVVSLITREAVDELGLAPGVAATAVVKATNVEIRR